MKKNNNKKLSKAPNKKNINENTKSKSNLDNKSSQKEKEVEKSKNIEVVNLIKTVKQKYNIVNIFSYLEEKTKLIIIVHNKKYQNLFGLDTNYYINKSEKYRIIEKNGICKEYTLKENKLVFEGEFKNGKKMAKQKKLILLMVKFHLKEHI